MIKIMKLTLVQYYFQQTIFRFCQLSHNILHNERKSWIIHYIQFSFLFSLLGLVTVSQSSCLS